MNTRQKILTKSKNFELENISKSHLYRNGLRICPTIDAWTSFVLFDGRITRIFGHTRFLFLDAFRRFPDVLSSHRDMIWPHSPEWSIDPRTSQGCGRVQLPHRIHPQNRGRAQNQRQLWTGTVVFLFFFPFMAQFFII